LPHILLRITLFTSRLADIPRDDLLFPILYARQAPGTANFPNSNCTSCGKGQLNRL